VGVEIGGFAPAWLGLSGQAGCGDEGRTTSSLPPFLNLPGQIVGHLIRLRDVTKVRYHSFN
jgi:hypothetical protein